MRFKRDFTSPEQEANHLIGRYQESFGRSKWVSVDKLPELLDDMISKIESGQYARI